MIGRFCWYLDQNILAYPSLAQCIENQRKTVYREKKIETCRDTDERGRDR